MQLREDLEQTRSGLSEAESHLGDDSEKLTSWGTELATIGPELSLLHELEESSAEALLKAEEAMHNWQHRWD